MLVHSTATPVQAGAEPHQHGGRSMASGRRARPLWPRLIPVAVLASATAAADLPMVRSQLLYVPVYSEIAYGDRRHTLNLSATVTIRNTDRKHPIKLTRVDYFDTAGRLIRSYQAEPRQLPPMASGDYVISGADRSGGTAASFLIAWESAVAVSPPLVEAVMIGAAATNGISFSSTAQILEERP